MALEKYEHHFSPEELVGFIYAVLHAPTYRAKRSFCAHRSAARHFGLFLKRQALSVTGVECRPEEW